jgi:agmatine/peptidylarginine deiminase
MMHRLPAEWEPQQAVMLTWPHADTDWAEQLEPVEAVYRHLAQLITREQALLIVCRDEAHRRAVQAQLAALPSSPPAHVNDGADQMKHERCSLQYGRIRFALAPSNDTWTRDHGPITVIDEETGARVLIDFRFNGWGGKYPATLDDRITGTVHAAGGFDELTAAHSDTEASRGCPTARPQPHESAAAEGASASTAGARLEPSPLVLEGGAIESDGGGTLLAVRRTIVDPARNPGWSLDAIEQELRQRLGVERILWLEHGQLSGDDTDGHIDTLARFCDPETICYAASDDPSDADHASLERLADELSALRRANGAPYRLLALPQPAPILDENGQRLPAGYVNFLITNRSVLVPVYGDPADTVACERLQQCFPGRAIEPVDCRALIRQGGSLHCITMQLPVGSAG